jgi:hypothetical protein
MTDSIRRKQKSKSGELPLSIVIVAVYSPFYIDQCLRALENQINPPEMEIIVVYHQGIGDVASVACKYPNTNFVFAPGNQTQGKMISIGIQNSYGKIVALTVDHCTPNQYWCSNIIVSHSRHYHAIGGALEKGNQPGSAVNWAVHIYDYCSYGYYLPPVKDGPALELSDCNVSYKMEVLNEYKAKWKNEFHVPIINRAFLGAGKILWFSPDLLVFQHRDIEFLRAARIAFQRGRAFANARIAKGNLGLRMIITVFALFLPIKLTVKLIKNVMFKRKELAAISKSFPFIIIFAILWSLGEFMGSIRGGRKYTIYINRE